MNTLCICSKLLHKGKKWAFDIVQNAQRECGLHESIIGTGLHFLKKAVHIVNRQEK